MAWGAVLLATVDSPGLNYEFLIIVLGPILAFFTSNVIAPHPNKDNNSAALVSNYINQSHQFFYPFRHDPGMGYRHRVHTTTHPNRIKFL